MSVKTVTVRRADLEQLMDTLHLLAAPHETDPVCAKALDLVERLCPLIKGALCVRTVAVHRDDLAVLLEALELIRGTVEFYPDMAAARQRAWELLA